MCGAPCRLGSRLSVPAAAARRLGLTRGHSAVEVGHATVARAAAARTSVVVPLSRRAKRALATLRSVGLELRVTATPLDGRARVISATRLTLRRAGRSPSVTALRATAAASAVWLGWDALARLR